MRSQLGSTSPHDVEFWELILRPGASVIPQLYARFTLHASRLEVEAKALHEQRARLEVKGMNLLDKNVELRSLRPASTVRLPQT